MATFKPVILKGGRHFKADGTTNIKIRLYHNGTVQYISTEYIWYYDYRTNINRTLKKNPLIFEDLQEFVSLYLSSKRIETWSENNPQGRWRKFSFQEIVSREKINLDIFWLRDNNSIDINDLLDPDELIDKIYQDLENVLRSIQSIKDSLNE